MIDLENNHFKTKGGHEVRKLSIVSEEKERNLNGVKRIAGEILLQDKLTGRMEWTPNRWNIDTGENIRLITLANDYDLVGTPKPKAVQENLF